MKKKSLLVFSLSFLLVGCINIKRDPSSSNNGSNATSGNGNTITNNGDTTSLSLDEILDKDAYKDVAIDEFKIEKRTIASKLDVTFDDFFNPYNKVSIQIDISDSELQKLENDFDAERPQQKTEKYRHAEKVTISLTNEGNTFVWEFDDVGIRQKGNMSRNHILIDGEIQTFHVKLSFDETWDDPNIYSASELTTWTSEADRLAREDRNFLGLSGLDTKWNACYDETNVKEIYASMLYRANGIISQHVTLGEMSMTTTSGKTKNMGLFRIFEPASKSLIKRSLKNDSFINMAAWSEEKIATNGVSNSSYGDLYKCSYGYGNGSYGNGADLTVSSGEGNRIGVNSADGSYVPVYNRKTNMDAGDDSVRLRTCLTNINSSDYATIDSYVDLRYLAVEEAVSYMLGNPDDLRNNSNNYMIYLRRTDGKMIIIPIDYDRCFGTGGSTWNPDGNNMTKAEVFSLTAQGKQSETKVKLLKNTFLSSTTNYAKAVYLNQVKAIKASSWWNLSTFETLYSAFKNTYSGYSFSLTPIRSGDISFEKYITEKGKMINLDLVLNGGGSGSSSTSSNQTTSQSTSLTVYDNVYLAGYKGNWYTKDYPLVYQGDGIYKCVIENVECESFSFKFNNGSDWNEINWGLKDGTSDELSLNSGGNFPATGLTLGSIIEIVVNMNTMKVSINTVS